MASVRRNTIRINFVKITSQLKELVSRVYETSTFIKRHVQLLSLVTSDFDEQMMSVLFQFFDQVHHCFTFPDYQLVPTLEEFYRLLGISIIEQVPFTGMEEVPRPEDIASALHLKLADIVSNWETRSGVEGFLAKFLIDQAQLFWDSLDFQAFEDILALFIYGLVLFPNLDSFIDVNVVKNFLSRNPVPTLLSDILHAL